MDGQPAFFLRLAGLLDEEVFAHAPDWAGLVKARAMKLVRARLRGDIENAASGAAHFRIVGVDLDFHFLERFNRRIEHGPAAQLGDRYAVEQVVVRAHAATAHRNARGVGLILLAIELRVAGRRHRRHRDADHEGVAAGRGQRLQDLAIQRAARRSVGRLDERSVGGDGDGLLQLAHFERDVEREKLLRRDAEALAFVGLEAGQSGPDRVGRRRDRREIVFPGGVRGRLARPACLH